MQVSLSDARGPAVSCVLGRRCSDVWLDTVLILHFGAVLPLGRERAHWAPGSCPGGCEGLWSSCKLLALATWFLLKGKSGSF